MRTKVHHNARHRKLWKDRRLELIKDQVCIQCGKDSDLCIHHTHWSAYLPQNFHLYESLSNKLPFVILCRGCHNAIHNGYNLCPKCLKKYKKIIYSQCFECSGKKSLYDMVFEANK